MILNPTERRRKRHHRSHSSGEPVEAISKSGTRDETNDSNDIGTNFSFFF